MDVYIWDGAIYCESCAPQHADGPYPDGGGEADCPQHCDNCGMFLDNPLTSDGVEYVVQALRENIASGRGNDAVLEEWADSYNISLSDLLRKS